MTKKLTCLDLFSGAGGLSEGFLQTGAFDFLAHIEWEKPMVDTLRNNLVKRWHHSEEQAKQSVIHFDIQKTDELIHGGWNEETIVKYAKTNSDIVVKGGLNALIGDRHVDVIIGGPPCQAYSIAGRAQDPNSMKFDYRNYLFESFVKVVDFFQPQVFVFENVPGILSAKPGDKLVIERICEAFEKIGYEIRTAASMKQSIYSSADYSVPQERHRVIIYGVNKTTGLDVEAFYSSLNSLKSKGAKRTVRDAIGNMPKFKPLEKPYRVGNKNVSHILIGNKIIPLHDARYHSLRDMGVFRQWLSNNMNNLPNEEKLKFYKQVSGKDSNHNKYRSLEWDKPSPTIVSHLYKDGLMFIHPDIKQLRSITIREAALLQSFPMEYEFLGSSAYCFKMIGNAVPVLFAKCIAESIINVLDNSIRKPKRVLNVLVACEESQRVCSEFRKLGHNAFSCDILECSGGHPEWHFNCDVLEVIKNKGGILQNGEELFINGDWDLMIAHPPCTFLAVSGAKWYYDPADKGLPIEKRRPHPRFPNRAQDREEAVKFFMTLANADIDHIAIENPVGIMNSRFRKPNQVVQPYYFGDSASKTTCLWLKNLPKLVPTKIVDKGEFIEFDSGKRLPKWFSDAFTKTKTAEERRRMRSKTFPGFAKAMAEQWSEVLENEDILKKD